MLPAAFIPGSMDQKMFFFPWQDSLDKTKHELLGKKTVKFKDTAKPDPNKLVNKKQLNLK